MPIIDLDDARASLGDIPTTRDADLEVYVEAASNVVEDIVGPVTPREVVETFSGGRYQLILSSANVTDVTSVETTDGGTLAADVDYTVDLPMGVIRAGIPTAWTAFTWGVRNVTVTYTAGFDPIPANLILATRRQLQWMWRLSEQGNRPAFGEAPEGEEFTPSGLAVARDVIALCGSYRRARVIA